MKSKLIITGIVALILVAIIWRLAENTREVNARREVGTTEISVSVTTAPAEMRETSRQLNLVGTTVPCREVMVASETSGRIIQHNFKLGDFVPAGSVLIRVDGTFRRLALQTAQLNFDRQLEDYVRFQALRRGDAVTETQLRDMRMAYENAEIQLENAQKQFDDTKIVAPFSGYITSRNTELGAFVNIGTTIAGITDISQLKISLSVSEGNVYQLQTGQAVSARTNVFPSEIFQGTITSISPQGSAAHTYPVEITIVNRDQKPLKAGTYVNVQIYLDREGKALMIPRNAIVSSVKDPSVYIVKNGVAQLTRIVTGQNYDSFLEVLSGLNVGDQVVTGGQINLSDGAMVSVIQ